MRSLGSTIERETRASVGPRAERLWASALDSDRETVSAGREGSLAQPDRLAVRPEV